MICKVIIVALLVLFCIGLIVTKGSPITVEAVSRMRSEDGPKLVVKTKRLNPDAELPKKAYKEDFCYDVIAVSEKEVAPGVWKYGLGLAFEIDREMLGDEAVDLAIDFRPRSSVWKTGMVLSNCEGTIDETYRGEVGAVFYHVMPNMPRYKVGDKIGQIKLGLALPLKFVDAAELSETERGTKGWGSTGK